MEDFFFSKDRILKLSPLRGVYFLIFGVFFVLTELGRRLYRPYIYQNGLDDFGFADVVGNLFGVVAIIFFNLGSSHTTRRQGIHMVAFVMVGIIGYELLQGAPRSGVFDWKDVLATVLAGMFSLILLLLVTRTESADSPEAGQPPKKTQRAELNGNA